MTARDWFWVGVGWLVVASALAVVLGRLLRHNSDPEPAACCCDDDTVVLPIAHDWQDEMPVDALSDAELADRLHRIEVAEGWAAA